MPKLRQRIVFCDCLDCVEQPRTTDITSSLSPANEAAARQEPPPKCLLLVATGLLVPAGTGREPTAPSLLELCSLPHLNKATREGGLTLLAMPTAGTEHGGAADAVDPTLAELAEVLGIGQVSHLSSCSPCLSFMAGLGSRGLAMGLMFPLRGWEGLASCTAPLGPGAVLQAAEARHRLEAWLGNVPACTSLHSRAIRHVR